MSIMLIVKIVWHNWKIWSIRNAESNHILSYLTQLLPTKKATKSPKNRPW